MSAKKGSKTRKGRATETISTTKGEAERRRLRAELARHLAGVLTNPETPEGIADAVSGELLELEDARRNHIRLTPEYILEVLDFHAARGGARA